MEPLKLQWMQELETPSQKDVLDINEKCLPDVKQELELLKASRIHFLKRGFQSKAIASLEAKDIRFGVQEVENLGVAYTEKLGIQFSAMKPIDGKLYLQSVSPEHSMDIIETLTPEERAIVADYSVLQLHEYLQETLATHSTRSPIGHRAYRLSNTYPTHLLGLWRELRGEQNEAIEQ